MSTRSYTERKFIRVIQMCQYWYRHLDIVLIPYLHNDDTDRVTVARRVGIPVRGHVPHGGTLFDPTRRDHIIECFVRCSWRVWTRWEINGTLHVFLEIRQLLSNHSIAMQMLLLLLRMILVARGVVNGGLNRNDLYGGCDGRVDPGESHQNYTRNGGTYS